VANTGSASGAGSASLAGACESVRGTLEKLYSDGQANPVIVADNVAMILRECQSNAAVVGCVNAATSAAEVTIKCTSAIDDNGSEGNQLFGANR
jgi:hypothetical protein